MRAALAMLILAAPFSRAQTVEDLISQVSLGEYQGYLRTLTGVDPVPWDPDVHLYNRNTFDEGSFVAADYLHGQLAATGLNVTRSYFGALSHSNIIAELPGTTRPQDIYVFCAHYDTAETSVIGVQPGCDDNGSGTAAVLMAARIFAQYQFDATIRFIAFSGEEQGMIGSQAYVNEIANNDENVVAAINYDMILDPGFDNLEPDPDHDFDISSNSQSMWLADFLAGQFEAYTPLEVETHLLDVASSDHWSFWQRGYHAVRGAENTALETWGGANAAYHTAADTLDNPDYDWEFGLHGIRGGMAALANLAGLVPEASAGFMLAALAAAARRR